MSQRELVKSQNTPTGRRQDPVIISCAPGVLCTAVIASEAHPGPREGSPFLHLQVNAPCARLNTFTNRPKARPTAAPLRVGNFLHGGSAACHLVSCASAWPWSCRASGYRLNIGVPMGVTVQINGLESPASVRPDFLACTITTDCPDNFDHSLRRKGRKATANMVSQLLARAAVLAATCGFAAAQTTSACDPTKGGACAPDKAFGGSWGYDFSSKSKLPDLKDAWNLDGGVEFADPATVTLDGSGATFLISKPGQAPTINTTHFMFFGRLDIVMKPAKGQGIVSSIVLQSDDRDEIDWVSGTPVL